MATRFDFVAEWRDALIRWPRDIPWPRFAATMALAFVAGYVASRAGLPLPWMIGPMAVCLVASIAGLPLAAPAKVRMPMVTVIGVMLGSRFTPELLDQLPQWTLSIAGLAFYCAVAGALSVWYLRRAAGFDLPTAYFAGMPGGLAEMSLLSAAFGGDERKVALIHAARVMLVVFTLPFLLLWLEGAAIGGDRPQPGASILATPISSDLWLVGCAVAGAWLGHRLRLPASAMLGPMLVSAAVHVVSAFKPPNEIVNLAQMVVGSVLGCRFVGIAWREVAATIRTSVVVTAIMMLTTVGFALLLGPLTGLGTTTFVLGYAPGGMVEMSLIAVVLHAEVAFVAAHHILRITMIMLAAGPIFRFGQRGGAPPPTR
jgi:membrane AbrB-like protein